MSVDLKHCEKTCEKCIRCYIKKHRLSKGGHFNIECEGIPKEYIPENVLAVLPDPEVSLAMMDPVAWAAKFVDWHCLDPEGKVWKRKHDDGTLKDLPKYNEEQAKAGKSIFHRPYQAELLRCSANRKVARIGRQCLTEKVKLQCLGGIVKSIKDVQVGDKVYSLNTETNKLELDTVTDSWISGEKKVYQIKTKFGHSIECSEDHPFWTAKGACDRYNNRDIQRIKHDWLSIKTGIKPGLKIALSLKEEMFGDVPLPQGLPELLGYFIADGSASKKQSCKFTNTTQEYLEEFTNLCIGLGTSVKPYKKGRAFDLIITNGRRKQNPVRDLLKSLGLVNITGPQKFIPDILFRAPKSQIKAFVERFWAADGYVYVGKRTGRKSFKVEIGNLQENRVLLEQLQTLFWRFGVHGYIKPEGKNWRLVISNKISVKNFLEQFGDIPGKLKQVALAKEIVETIADKYHFEEEDVLWDYVTSIKEIGVCQTYDITVEKNHNFIANGIITKNSGKTEALCIAILYNVFTHSDFTVEVIAPYQSQIELIFTRLAQLISSNTNLEASKKRYVKAPNYTLELHNGSLVRGFTAATRSGGEAGAARGQHANMLAFDESDYLNDSDIDAALAMIINYPDALVWMSSTPTGKRQTFYKTCVADDMFKEFHYPSTVNPNWTPKLEELYRRKLTALGYIHEILGEFGEQEEGVYQVKYVEAAQSDYDYSSMKRSPNWIYHMGVDWNGVKTGTAIHIVGWNPGDRNFYLVDKQLIMRDGWNSNAACQLVMELNRIWRPAWIYVDTGYGHMQIETLHQIGRDALRNSQKGATHPDAKLARIVKGYEFGGSIEIKDPFTNQLVKKPAKSFMVESSVRLFEANTLRYPKSDEDLTRALQGYKIKRVNQSGVPIYEQGDEQAGDHFLDALNLALVSFVLEDSEYRTSVKYDPYMVISNTRLGSVLDNTKSEPTGTAYQDSPPAIVARALQQTRGGLFSSQLPASNTTSGITGVFSWPGFSYDAPRPQAHEKKQLSLFSRRRNPPKRSNI